MRCGLGETTTAADVDVGRVVVTFGLAMLKPAEFLYVRIGQKNAGRPASGLPARSSRTTHRA